jgi:hypothetical protein
MRNILMSVVVLISIASASASNQSSPLSMTITVEGVLTLGQPVQVLLSIQNAANEEILADLGDNRVGQFAVSMNYPDGSLRRARFPEARGVARISTVRVPARGLYKQRLLLDEALQFSQEGRYEGAVEFAGEVSTESGVVLDSPRAFPLSFVIAPRNAAALDQAYSRLATLALTADATERLEATKALSAVRDPIVVKYLEHILAKTTHYDGIVLNTLAQIASDDARRALEAAAASDNVDRAKRARQALLRSGRGQNWHR